MIGFILSSIVSFIFSTADGDMFMHVFVHRTLPICEPFPGRNSVVVMDGASPHLKDQLRAACARVGVLCLFLPAYGYVLNPTELAINAGRSMMRRKYGAAHVYVNVQGRKCRRYFCRMLL